ncbi:MAG: dTDP-4-dehydrorhamnose reductase [Endomicrobiales bacterium]
MKILVTGITGLLGSALAESLETNHEVIGLSQTSSLPGFETRQVDISDYDALYRTVTRVNPDMVIHAAVFSNVDECETDPERAFRVNSLGTRNVALACQRFDAALMYFSTDYVFSGIGAPAGGYKEFDGTGPSSAYAKSKLYGEWYVRHLLNKFYIIRTAWLFGPRRANFVTGIAEALARGREVIAVADMVSSPTYVADLAEAASRLVDSPRYGIYHLTNGGFASRYEIARSIAGMMKKPADTIRKLTQKQLKLKAPRPVFSGLDNFVWKTEGFAPLRPWQDAVKEFLCSKFI